MSGFSFLSRFNFSKCKPMGKTFKIANPLTKYTKKSGHVERPITTTNLKRLRRYLACDRRFEGELNKSMENVIASSIKFKKEKINREDYYKCTLKPFKQIIQHTEYLHRTLELNDKHHIFNKNFKCRTMIRIISYYILLNTLDQQKYYCNDPPRVPLENYQVTMRNTQFIIGQFIKLKSLLRDPRVVKDEKIQYLNELDDYYIMFVLVVLFETLIAAEGNELEMYIPSIFRYVIRFMKANKVCIGYGSRDEEEKVPTFVKSMKQMYFDVILKNLAGFNTEIFKLNTQGVKKYI